MVDVKQPEIAIYVADDDTAPYTTGTRDDKSTYSGWRTIKHESQMPVTFVDEHGNYSAESLHVDNILPSNESMQQLIHALEWKDPIKVDHVGKIMLFVSGEVMNDVQYQSIVKLKNDGWRIGVIHDNTKPICDNKRELAHMGVALYDKEVMNTPDKMNYLMRELAFG